jgi:hypothetical protein
MVLVKNESDNTQLLVLNELGERVLLNPGESLDDGQGARKGMKPRAPDKKKEASHGGD